MRKKILMVLFSIIILRIINILFINYDPLFYLSPRNFNGRGMLVIPSLIDFLIPLLVILALRDRGKKLELDFLKMPKPLLLSFIIILTPVITGIFLSNYIQKTFISFEFSIPLVLRFILLIISFLAINIFADSLNIKNRFLRMVILFLAIASIAYLQDSFGASTSTYVLLTLVNSIGLSTIFLAVGLRKSYRKMPVETLIAVSIVSVFIVFFIFNGLSVSFFTIFLPTIATFIVTLCIYKQWKIKTKIIVGLTPFVLALFLNYVFPGLLPPEAKNEIIEKKNEQSFFTDKYNDITVKYRYKYLREISLNLARVIDFANKISKKELGVSPHVRELVITGIGPGGFHAEFPDKIIGRIISKKYIKNCMDQNFLNNDKLSPHFPDPVNAVLHEYSHLFGVIPYHKWLPGPEEEGWATFSATILAKLLYNNNKELWKPSYDFYAQAEKITKLNISGKAVVWSHPHEFGGFNLWYHLSKIKGLKTLYQLRWENSFRNLFTLSLYYISNPGFAKKVVNVFGKEYFLKYGKYKPQVFGNIYSKEDFLYLAETTGIDKKRILRMYEFMKNRKIDPSVPIPE